MPKSFTSDTANLYYNDISRYIWLTVKWLLQTEDRVNYEIMKSQAYAARVAKRINKQPRMRVLTDDEPAGKYTLIQCTTVVELVIYI